MFACRGARDFAYGRWMKYDNEDGKLPHEMTDPYRNSNPRLSCPDEPVYNTGTKV